MPFLSMIVMIKGIYLITGLLNYSSVEAHLFRRMLIVLLSLRHCLASRGCRLLAGCADQHSVKAATEKKTGKEKEGNTVLVLKGSLPGTCPSLCLSCPIALSPHNSPPERASVIPT